MTKEDKKYFENLLAKHTRDFKKESERHMGVLMEHFESQVIAVAEQYTSLQDSTNERFDAVDAKFDAVDARFDGIDEKLDQVIDILHANQEILVEHDRAIKELQQAR